MRCAPECSCGRHRPPSAQRLAVMTTAATKHGHSRRKTGQTPTYYTWKSMLMRATNPKHKDFYRYGGRWPNPVTVEDSRWFDFRNFLVDMGDRPTGMTIDRVDNERGYFKDNCRWATASEQSRNQRPRRRKAA